jgi:CHAT domain-containing protein
MGQNNSPGYATLKLGVGKLFVQQGDHASGQSSFLQALEVLDSIKAEKRNEYEESVFELAKSYYRERSVGQATPRFRKLSTLMQESMLRATKYFSEKDLLGMQAAKERERHHLLSYCLTFPDAELQGECYNLSLTAKLLLLENQLGVRRMLSSADRATQEEYNRWIGLQRRIAVEYVKPAAGRKDITFLEAQSDSLERNLARSMADFGNILRIANRHDVQTALQPDEAALEFVHFNYYSPASTDSVIYAALLLKSGMKHPLFIPMCTEKQLAALLSGEKGKSEKYHLNDLYGIDPATGNNALYQLLWAPLDAHLSGLRTVYYSSSGLLHRLNLSALPTAAQTTLADQYDLVLLGSTRQLAYQARHITATEPPSALLYGGIQFSMDSTAYPAPATSSADNRGGPAFDQTDAALRGEEYWAFLNGSDKEVDRIQAVLSKAGVPVQAVKGWKATEESFKQIGQADPSPKILHISTHGFFFPDPDLAAGDGPVEQLGEHVVRLSDHPMIRSGLILAGANHAWKTGRPLGNREDGILTAYEISQLDLRHTDLVVLSGCKTGLGHIEANEGVYGLQRAFKIAGARTLVMSLWKAPDHVTQEMMAVFYQKLLGENLPARQALRAAQSEMRRRRYEPYHWAGFVVVE